MRVTFKRPTAEEYSAAVKPSHDKSSVMISTPLYELMLKKIGGPRKVGAWTERHIIGVINRTMKACDFNWVTAEQRRENAAKARAARMSKYQPEAPFRMRCDEEVVERFKAFSENKAERTKLVAKHIDAVFDDTDRRAKLLEVARITPTSGPGFLTIPRRIVEAAKVIGRAENVDHHSLVYAAILMP